MTVNNPASADERVNLAEAVPVCIDRVAARYARPPLDREIAAARAEFDRRRGAVCDDEELFDTHMAAFLEWYVIERPVAGDAPPVVQALGAGQDEDLGGPGLLRALALSHRSLFEVLDPGLTKPTGVRLLDLVGGGIWRVDLESPMTGLARGDIFEARLIPWEQRVRFGPVFCFHPREARESIHALVEQARGGGWSDQDLTFTLGQMRLQHSRCRNIPAQRVYCRRERVRP